MQENREAFPNNKLSEYFINENIYASKYIAKYHVTAMNLEGGV